MESRMPSASGSVLMDLQRMDRIVDFSEELGYAMVEPGVTQAQHGSQPALQPSLEIQ
jgi:4-cresol dehydrogenase (hydroxylating)